MMSVTTAAERFLNHRRAMGCSAHTLRIHGFWLELWGRWRTAQQRRAALAEVDVTDFVDWLLHLGTDYRGQRNRPLAPHSRLSAWTTLRAFWTWANEEGLLVEHQRNFFPRRVPRPIVEESIRPTYDDATLAALLNAAAAGELAAAARDRALILLLLESGVRASEVCSLEVSRCEFGRRRAQVKGKGGRWAWIHWGDAAAEALAAWQLRRPHVKHDRLFVSLGRGKQHGVPLTYNGLRLIVQRLAKRAGVQLPRGASIHALRHTFAHDLLGANVQTIHLQQLLRHRDHRSTERYTRERPDQLGQVRRRAYRRRSS